MRAARCPSVLASILLLAAGCTGGVVAAPNDTGDPGATADAGPVDAGGDDGGATDGGTNAGADAGGWDGGDTLPDGGLIGGPIVPVDPWVTAVLASWNHYAGDTDGDGKLCGNWGNLTSAELDFDAFTHLVYLGLTARPDGTLPEVACDQNLDPDKLLDIVPAAHAHGRPILISLGGGSALAQAMNDDTARTALVDHLATFVTTWGFDGVDLDLEPVAATDQGPYVAFAEQLRARLDTLTPAVGTRMRLTASAVVNRPALFARLQDTFDQVNLLSFELMGLWSGWPSWHGSALYQAGVVSLDAFPVPVPSVSGLARAHLAAGIPRRHLGVAIPFTGTLWVNVAQADVEHQRCTGEGITAPGAFWSYHDAGGHRVDCADRATAQVMSAVPYYNLARYLALGTPSYDPGAAASYLGLKQTVIALDLDGDGDTWDGFTLGSARGYEGNALGTPEDLFVSYESPKAIGAKLDYVRAQGLGGVVIWELGAGYFRDGDPGDPTGPRDPLLQAVKQAAGLPR